MSVPRNSITPVQAAECIKQLTQMGITRENAHTAISIAMSTGTTPTEAMEVALRWIIDEQGGTVEDPHSSSEFLDSSSEVLHPPPADTKPLKSILKNSGVYVDNMRHSDQGIKHGMLSNAFRKIKSIAKNGLSGSQSLDNNSALSQSPTFSSSVPNYNAISRAISNQLSISSITSLDENRRYDRSNPRSGDIFCMFNGDDRSQISLSSSPVDVPFKVRQCSSSASLDSFKKVVKFSFPSEVRAPICEEPVQVEERKATSAISVPRVWGGVDSNSNSVSSFESVMSMNSNESIPSFPTEISSKAVEDYYLQWCVNSKSEMIVKLLEDIQLISSPLFKINLTGCVINKDNFIPLLRVLNLDIPLRELCLNETQLDDTLLKQILIALANSNLHTLGIASNKNISAYGIKHLSRFIKAHPSLSSLNLAGVPLNKKSAGYLNQALCYESDHLKIIQSPLKRLNLENCHINRAVLETLSIGIAHSRLERISLRDNRKMSGDPDVLARLFRGQLNGTSILKYIDLRGCELGDSVIPIMDTISTHTSLEYLNLRGNLITPEILVSISDALTINNTLQCLDLSENQLSQGSMEGIHSLREMLLVNRNLKQIYLNSCELTCDAAITIAEILPMNQSIRVLHLAYNYLDVGGVLGLAAALKSNFVVGEVEIETADMLGLVGEIKGYVQRNKERVMVASPVQIDENVEMVVPNDDEAKFFRNIDSAVAVSQVLFDIMSPLNMQPRTASIDVMVDVSLLLINLLIQQLYQQCKSYDETILKAAMKHDKKLSMLASQLTENLSLYDAEKFKTPATDAIEPRAVPVRVFTEGGHSRSASVLSGLFKSDSQFSINSLDKQLAALGAGGDTIEVPADVEAQMEEIDAFLRQEAKIL